LRLHPLSAEEIDGNKSKRHIVDLRAQMLRHIVQLYDFEPEDKRLRDGNRNRAVIFDSSSDLGVDRYLGKPYQEAELLAQISEVLEQRALEPSHD